jgi:hypothetical protein
MRASVRGIAPLASPTEERPWPLPQKNALGLSHRRKCHRADERPRHLDRLPRSAKKCGQPGRRSWPQRSGWDYRFEFINWARIIQVSSKGCIVGALFQYIYTLVITTERDGCCVVAMSMGLAEVAEVCFGRGSCLLRFSTNLAGPILKSLRRPFGCLASRAGCCIHFGSNIFVAARAACVRFSTLSFFMMRRT